MKAPTPPPQEAEPHDSESWLHAQKLVNSLPRIPPVFTLAVRSLMADTYRGSESLSSASLFLVNRLIRSPTMKAILYYSALTFHNDYIDNCPHLSSSDLARLYKPGDLASIVGVACLYRTLHRLADSQSGSTGVSALTKRMLAHLNVAGYVGYAIPAIGAGRSILATASLPLAHLLFYHLNKTRGQEYLQSIYEKDEGMDSEFEYKIWGCRSHSLASCLIQKMGFGMQWMNGLMGSITSPALVSHIQSEATHFFYARYWVDILIKTGQPPTEKIPAMYYPAQKELYQLLFRTAQIREFGTKYTWANKGKNDISPSLTPQLYQEYLIEAAQPEEVKEFCSKNITSDLLEGISEQDYLDLTTKNTALEDI